MKKRGDGLPTLKKPFLPQNTKKGTFMRNSNSGTENHRISCSMQKITDSDRVLYRICKKSIFTEIPESDSILSSSSKLTHFLSDCIFNGIGTIHDGGI